MFADVIMGNCAINVQSLTAIIIGFIEINKLPTLGVAELILVVH